MRECGGLFKVRVCPWAHFPPQISPLYTWDFVLLAVSANRAHPWRNAFCYRNVKYSWVIEKFELIWRPFTAIKWQNARGTLRAGWLIGELLFQERQSLNFLKSLHFWRLRQLVAVFASDILLKLRVYYSLFSRWRPIKWCEDLKCLHFASSRRKINIQIIAKK